VRDRKVFEFVKALVPEQDYVRAVADYEAQHGKATLGTLQVSAFWPLVYNSVLIVQPTLGRF
jgi:hypothetical protein